MGLIFYGLKFAEKVLMELIFAALP